MNNAGNISFLDENFNTVSEPIDGYQSFFTDLYYYDAGNWELHLPASYFADAKEASYVFVSGIDFCGVIDEISYGNTGGIDLAVRGSSLESLLDRRVIDADIPYDGNIEDVVYDVVARCALTGDRTIPNFALAPKSGFTETADGAAETGRQLDVWLRDVLKPLETSYRIELDFVTKKLTFSLYKGLDRTIGNGEGNTPAIFSESFENLAGVSYTISKKNYKNYAYITGEYTQITRTNMVTDGGGTKEVTERAPRTVLETAAVGSGERRETLIKSDIRADSDQMSMSAYTQKLTQAGVEALGRHELQESVSGEAIAIASAYSYGEDYSLGDLCEVAAQEIGVQWQARVTGIMITYERSGVTYEPRFGEAEKLKSVTEIIKELI